MTVVAELFATLGLQPDERAWNHGNELIEHVKTAVEALALYEGFKHVIESFNSVAESVEHAELAAKSLGTTSAAIQELNYSTKLLGLSSEESEMALTHLAHSVSDASKGSGPAAEAFEKLGISMSDPAIKSGDTSKILDRVADSFAKLPDGATKTALSMDLFSRSGAQLIPLLDKGSAGLAEFREQAHATGNVIEGEGAEKLGAYTTAVRSIDSTFDGLKKTLAVALAPAVSELAEKFQAWLGQHHDQLIEAVTEAAHGLASALGVVADVVSTVYDTFVDAFNGDAGAQAILIGVAGIISATVIPAFVAWAAATIVATWPILAIGPALAAVAYGVIQLVKHWDQVKLAIRSAWEELKETGDAVLNWIADLPVIKQLLELMHWIKHAADVGVGNAIVESAAKGSSADFSHGQVEQDRQQQGDAYYAEHGTYAGMPQDQYAAMAAADEHPSASVSPSSGSPSYSTTIAPGAVQISIDAGSADANQTAQIAGRVVDDRLRVMLNDAHAGTRGRDR